MVPIIINFTDKNFNNKEFTNNSKNILNNTLNKDKLIEEDSTVDADERDLLYDILEENNSEINLVRYTTTEIDSLFKEVNYNLKDVRDTKLVKPIDIGLLPNEIKNIGNTKKRKDMFIKIVLPLIVKENNKIRIDRKRLFTILNKNSNTDIEKKCLDKIRLSKGLFLFLSIVLAFLKFLYVECVFKFLKYALTDNCKL